MRFPGMVAALLLLLGGTEALGQKVYKCQVGAELRFQQLPCPDSGETVQRDLETRQEQRRKSQELRHHWESRLDGTRWQVGGVSPGGALEAFHPAAWSFDSKGGFQAAGHWNGRYEVVGPGKLSAVIVHGGGAADQFTIEFDDELATFRASKNGMPYRHAKRIAEAR